MSWMGSVGTLSRSLRRGRGTLQLHRVLRVRHGPARTQQLSTWWFPQRSREGWTVLQVHGPSRTIVVHGEPDMLWAGIAGRWVDMWQMTSSDQPWDVQLLSSTTQTWDSDATAALGLVSLLSHGTLPVLEDDTLNTADRLLPAVCRQHCQSWQRRQGNETEAWAADLGTQRRQRSVHLRGHELYRRLRRRDKAMSQRQSQPDPADDDWSRQWNVPIEQQPGQGYDSHVVSIQMGSRGLQPCLDHLPASIASFSHPPVVVHAQDTK
eukprot:3938793-Rhodomonas_salina.1